MFPEIDILFSKRLKVDDFHEMYYEVCGNLTGVPVVFLHGGPGSGCNPMQRRFFDTTFYMIILIDQRGCGLSKKSKPSDYTLENNIEDIEALDRMVEPETNPALMDILWADPLSDENVENMTPEEYSEFINIDWRPNPARGCSYCYGYRTVKEFLQRNALVCLVRAHEQLRPTACAWHC